MTNLWERVQKVIEKNSKYTLKIEKIKTAPGNLIRSDLKKNGKNEKSESLLKI